MALFRFLKELVAGEQVQPPTQPSRGQTSSHASVNLNPEQGLERISPDLRGARLVAPVLIEQFDGDATPFVLGDSFFIFTEESGSEYDETGKKLREFPLPERIYRGYAVDLESLLLLGSKGCYLWRTAGSEFLPLKGKLRSVTTVAWVQDKLVLWEEDPEDDDGHHGEKSYRSESIRILDPRSLKLAKPQDQTLGGNLVEHRYSTRYSSRITSRLSPESRYEFRAEDPVGLGGTCVLTPGRESAIALHFSDDPPNGLEIGIPGVHLSAFPHFPQPLSQKSNGSVTDNWAFTRCKDGSRCTVAAWYDEGFQPLVCSGCGQRVFIRAASCECGNDLPESGLQPDAAKPGQLRFHHDFEKLWNKGVGEIPSDASLDKFKQRIPQFYRFEGLVVGVAQYGTLECYLSPQFEVSEPLFTAELRPFYGTTFRNPILDTARRNLWVLDCNNGPLRFALDPKAPNFGDFAESYEEVVRKPESYYSFLDMLLMGDQLFVQGDFFISVYLVKGDSLEHLSTRDKLGKTHGYELSADDQEKVSLIAKKSPAECEVLTWDRKSKSWNS
jgi:hypothetical protein